MSDSKKLRKLKDPRKFGKYEFYDPALDLSEPLEFEEIPSDDGDGDGQDDSKTVNIQEQKFNLRYKYKVI